MANESDQERRLSELESRFRSMTRETLEKEDSISITPFLVPMLKSRYAGRTNLVAVELGPGYSPVVPETLKDNLRTYIAVDRWGLVLEKQRELVAEGGGINCRFHSLVGDTRQLPLPSESCDLAIASCHNPVYERDEAERVRMLTEVHRVLKPGGEFVIFPWHFQHRYYHSLIWEGEEELEVAFDGINREFLRTVHKRLRTRPFFELFEIAEVVHDTFHGSFLVLRKPK